jgi:hypothetical protein
MPQIDRPPLPSADQLTLTTLWLSESVIAQLEEIAKGSNSTPSEVADQLLQEVLEPFAEV